MRSLRRSTQANIIASIAGFVAIFATLGTSVYGNGVHEPISLMVATDVIAGSPLLCDVQLSEGPANVTITSNPPGAIHYEGYFLTSHEVVLAQTSPDAAPGPVTVIVKTDGVQIATNVTYIH